MIIYSLEKIYSYYGRKIGFVFYLSDGLFFACTACQIPFGGETIILLSISEDSGPEDLESLAIAIHSLTGLPTTIRSLNRRGLRLEKGQVLDRDYTGPVLEEVLKTNKVIHEVPAEGVYRGKHVVVAPLHSREGTIVAAIGIVDLLATIDLSSVFQEYTSVLEEVEEAKK